MNVSLTPELEKFVQEELEGGFYRSASEVVRAALHRLKEDGETSQSSALKTLGQLETQLLQSVERLDRGQGIKGRVVFDRLRKRIKETRSRL